MPRGIQDRVRQRQEGFFAANQCRRVCNDWPLVAAVLLVLSLIVMRARTPARVDEGERTSGVLFRPARMAV
jgi:uncharacterized membrane protein YecN with MAPEG domain